MAVKADAEFMAKISAADNASGPMKKIEESSEGMMASLLKGSIVVAGFNQALELAHKAYELLAEPIAHCTELFIEQQKETYKLANSMAVVGDFSKGALHSFQEFAETLQNTSNIDKGVAEGLLGTAKTLGLSDEAAKKMVKTAGDLAVVMGTDIQGAFQALQGAQNGQIRGLARYGGAIKGFTEDQLKAGAATEYFAKRFDGLAIASTKSIDGLQRQVKFKLKDVQEEIGKLMVDLFNVPGGAKTKIEVLENVIKFIQEDVRPALMSLKDEFLVIFNGIKAGFGAVNFKELAEGFKVIGVAIGGLLTIFSITTLAPIIVSLGTVALTFGGIAAAVVILVAVLDLVYRNMEKLDKVWDLFAEAALVALASIAEAFLKLVKMIIEGWAKIFSYLPGIGKTISEGMQSGADEIGKTIDMLGKKAESSMDKVKEISKGLDMGAVGAAFKAGKDFMDKFSDAYGKGKDALNKGAAKAGEASDIIAPKNQAKETGFDPLAKEYQQLLEEMDKKNKSLAKSIEERGKTAIEVARIERDASLKEIEDLQKKIDLHHQLSPEVMARIQGEKDTAQNLFELKIDDIPKTWTDYLDDYKDAGKEISDGFSETFADLKGMFVEGGEITFDKILEAFGKVDMKKVASGAESGALTTAKVIGKAVLEGMETAGKVLKGIFSGDYIDQFANFIDEIGQIPEKLMKAFSHLDTTITNLVAGLPQMMERFMQMIPKITESIVKAFPKLIDMFVAYAPKVVGMMADVGPKIIGMILDAIPKIIDIIPVLFDKLEHTLPVVIGKLMDALPDIIFAVFRAIPKIIHSIIEVLIQVIMTILDKIAPIIESIIEGLLGAIGEIVTDIIEQLLIKGGIEKIIGGILRAIPKIVIAIIVGLWKGILALVTSIKRLFTGGSIEVPSEVKDFGKNFAKAVKDGVKTVSRDASKLFAIKDLTDTFKNANPAQALQEAVTEAIDGLTNEFKNLLQMLLDAWRWLWDNILGPFCELLKQAWMWIYDNIITPIVSAFQRVFQWLWDTILSPFVNFLRAALDPLVRIMQQFIVVVQQAFAPVIAFFQQFANTVWGAFAPVISFFQNMGGWISNAFSWVISNLNNFRNVPGWLGDLSGTINHMFETPGWLQPFIDAIHNLTSWGGIGDSLGGGGGGVGIGNSTLGANVGGGHASVSVGGYSAGFAMGGIIRAIHAAQGAFIPQGNDTVPVMGQAGEFIVNRESTNANLGALKMINSSKGAAPVSMGGNTVTIGEININAKTNLDKDAIRRDIVPELVEQIKRMSRDGQYIVAASGVRKF